MSPARLTLIRGLPGSGKSTLAKTLDAVHLEADMYFTNDAGDYQFDPRLLKEAHQWCLLRCEYYLNRGEAVVVANTFVKQWEMDDYRKLADKYHVELSIRRCVGEFANIHQVPEKTLTKMKRDWEA